MSAGNNDLSLDTLAFEKNQPSQDQQHSRNEAANASTSADVTLTGHNSKATDQHRPDRRPVKKSNKICRYYATQKGCRAGDSCIYQHIQSQERSNVPQSTESASIAAAIKPDSDATSASKVEPDGIKLSRPVFRPVAKPIGLLQKTNPRDFQIGQVIRRFTPTRDDLEDGSTLLKFNLQPSDPDFPFELAALKCVLIIPATWPAGSTKPVLKMENAEIPKGYQINIERGFESLVSPTKTLLSLLNELDKKLESFLSVEKAQTIKIVANRRREDQTPVAAAESVVTITATPVPPVDVQKPAWTQLQKNEARARREPEIRQLQARMSRLPLFSSSKDGTIFNIPLQIPKPGRLPSSLISLKEVLLTVPLSYHLDPCTVKLKGVYGTAVQNVEESFEKHASTHAEMTLMAHINYLTQHLHEMAVMDFPPLTKGPEAAIDSDKGVASNIEHTEPEKDIEEGIVDQDRPHLVFIARPPPEWNQQRNDEENDTETDSDEVDSDEASQDFEDEENTGGAAIPAAPASSTLEKGILISFPHLEMTGIELLELTNISLSVRCDRCKESYEFKNIKPAGSDTTSLIRTESCNKCASPMSASYRNEPMHTNSIKAGHLDLEGCTVLDMLPSTFQPTCSDCSTTLPLPGIITVRGDTALSVCRTCHHKMTLKIAEVKFLRVSQNDSRIHHGLPPKRKKEDLGITTGTELPLRGRCKHYSKSYRWFRFSCCNRVYPCDRCHDTAESHPNEHANRMICGMCSREQNYRPEDCGFCGRSVIRKTGGGFWEGGKGTRDRVKMNRNDPRKYKRIGGSGGGGN